MRVTILDHIELAGPLPAIQTFTFKYRLTSDPDIPGSYIALPNADINTDGTFVAGPYSFLRPDVTITLVVTNVCEENFDKEFPPLIITYEIGNTQCEQSDVFTPTGNISGLSSPAGLFWHEASGRMYVVDLDDANGSIWWFDPVTFSGPGGRNYIVDPNNLFSYIFTFQFDALYNRIYMAGRFGGGLLCFDMNAGVFLPTVPYGTDGAPPTPGTGNGFNRLSISVVANTIYCPDAVSGRLAIIQRDTLSLLSNNLISSISNGTTYIGNASNFYDIGNGTEVWVLPNQYGVSPNIGRYTTGLASFIGFIDISAHSALFVNSQYWRGPFIDTINGKLLLTDFGKSEFIVIDTITRAIEVVEAFSNRSGKSFTVLSVTRNPIGGELYLSGAYVNSDADSTAIVVAFRLNNSYNIDRIYVGGIIDQLTRYGVTDQLFGTNSGAVRWSGLPNWDIDGLVTKFNTVGAGDQNTGYMVVLDLDQELDGNPTGVVIPNTPGDPNYEPKFLDLDDCAIDYSLDCPDGIVATPQGGGDVTFDFSLNNSVVENPAIDTVRFKLMTGTTTVDSTDIALPNVTPNYFSGIITGATTGSRNVGVDYLLSGVIVSSCNGLGTIIVT